MPLSSETKAKMLADPTHHAHGTPNGYYNYGCRETCCLEAMRDYHRQHTYGVSREQYNQMLASQDGVCPVCYEPPADGEAFVVDHCHDTGEVRGLLHLTCNSGIGQLKDCPVICQQAVYYLTNSKGNQCHTSG